MDTIDVIDGRFTIPERFELSKDKRVLKVRTPWTSEVQKLCRGDIQISIQKWFRHKSSGEQPFIPEGFIEIDGTIFQAVIRGSNG